MSDQPKIQSTEDKVDSYTEMPESAEFSTLPSDVQKGLINKFPAPSEDQEEEESKSPEKESEDTDQPQKDDPKSEESDKKDKPDIEPTKGAEPDVAKNYKSLQAEFTRKSQKLSSFERENAELKQKLAALSKGKESKETEEESPLDKLAADNPKAKELIDALREDMERRLSKGIQPIEEKLTRKQAEDNLSRFQEEVDGFLKSPLGGLEQEFNELVKENFENQDAMLEAAASDPALFDKLKKEVLAQNFVKAAELSRAKQTPEEKNKIVQQTGVSGKAKTTTEVDDDLELATFRKKKTSQEMKETLRKVGVVKN